MSKSASRWLELIAGILMIVAGIVSFTLPLTFAAGLVWVMSFAVLLGGIIMLVFYIRNRGSLGLSAGLLLSAILDIILGLLLVFSGTIAAGAAFAYVIAIWFLLAGILRILWGIQVKGTGYPRWWVSLVVGILTVILAIIVLFNPLLTILTLSILVGIYVLVIGIFAVIDFFTNK